MPDRFDLMNTQDVSSAFRITADYCRLVNPDRLVDTDLRRLDRGRTWLAALAAEVQAITATKPFASDLIENHPLPREASISVEQALSRFAQANREAATATEHLLTTPKATVRTSRGQVSYLDLARHLARISNSCSVDQRWLWGTDVIEAELSLLDEEPRHVCGSQAFVLFQAEVGRVEIGNPLPDDEIWNHLSGDLRFTMVEELNGGVGGQRQPAAPLGYGTPGPLGITDGRPPFATEGEDQADVELGNRSSHPMRSRSRAARVPYFAGCRDSGATALAQMIQADLGSSTSLAHTWKLLSRFGPNVVVMATSLASRPRAIRIRARRGTTLRGSTVSQRPLR